MQLGSLQLRAMQFIVSHLDIVQLLAFSFVSLVQAMTIIEHIVGRHNHQQQHYQQNHGDALVDLRLLHRAAIVGQRIICRHLLKELCIYLIIIIIERPLVQRQGGYGTLVTDVEDNLIVDIHAVMIPLYLSRQLSIIALRLHQQLTMGT